MDKAHWGRRRSERPQQLIVLCHGIDADGNQMNELAHAWADAAPKAAFVAPHAPFRHSKRVSRWLPFRIAARGRQWYSLVGRSLSAQESGVRIAAGFLDRFVDAELHALALPPDAYALVGFSQGATTALFAGLRRPVAPRSIIAFSGALINPSALTTEIRNHAPVLLIHGEADEIVPVSNSREAEQALRAIGVPVEAVYRPGLGHAIDAVGVAVGARSLWRAFA
jgi:phospholipase/carboxylesterase